MSLACPDCGTLLDIPPLQRGASAVCPVCDNTLERTGGRSISVALACALTTFILLLPANLLPFLGVSMLGMHRETQLGSGVISLWNEHWVVVAGMVAAFVIVLPFVRFALLSTVLICVRFGGRPPWLGRAFRWAMALDLWAMPDVFLLGSAVGYSRVEANLPVAIGLGGYAFIGAAFLAMLSRATLDQRTVWRAITPEREPPEGEEPVISCTACDLVVPASVEHSHCPRCAARLYARKPETKRITVALAIAGLALYFPANTYPMSLTVQLGEDVPRRIIDGIRDLADAHLWPLAALVFCTSIAIPFLKLISLLWFVISIRLRSSRGLLFRTKLYRVIDEIGRWSYVDVYTIAVFVPLLQFGAIASTRAMTAITPFAIVVALTMVASRIFDPRLMWDAARPSSP